MNVLCLSGNLCKEIETRKTQDDLTIANLSIAVNMGKDKTEFVNCVAFGKTADLMKQYCQKGDRLSLNGYLQTRSWDDKEGNKRYSTECVVNQFDFPPKKSGAEKPAPSTGGGSFDDEIPFMRYQHEIMA